MKRRMRLAADAMIGAREEQQDSFGAGLARLADGREAQLVVIADGMGGHAGGSTASTLAIEHFLAAAESGRWPDYAETLRQALLAANRAIASRAEQEPQLEGMGCTMVAVAFDERVLWMISVGDSLLLRINDNGLERLNADHSMAGLIGDGSDVGAAQHLLRSALTGRTIPLIDEGRFSLDDDTRYLLATDGILTLPMVEILAILDRHAAAEPMAQAQALLAAVAAANHFEQDNCTVIVVRTPRAPRKRFSGRRIALGLLLVAIGGSAATLAWRYGAGDTGMPGNTASAGAGAPGIGADGNAAASGRREGYAPPPVATPVPRPSPSPGVRASRDAVHGGDGSGLYLPEFEPPVAGAAGNPKATPSPAKPAPPASPSSAPLTPVPDATPTPRPSATPTAAPAIGRVVDRHA